MQTKAPSDGAKCSLRGQLSTLMSICSRPLQLANSDPCLQGSVRPSTLAIRAFEDFGTMMVVSCGTFVGPAPADRALFGQGPGGRRGATTINAFSISPLNPFPVHAPTGVAVSKDVRPPHMLEQRRPFSSTAWPPPHHCSETTCKRPKRK